MKDKEKQFNERIECGIAYCEDTSNNQIEEMAKVIKEVKYEPFNDGKPTYKVGNQMEDFVFDLIAEALYNEGYRKIDKDSVTLSREEYVRLQLCELKSCEPPVYIDIERIEQEIADKYNQKLKSERDMMIHDLYVATKQSHEEGCKRGYDKGKYEASKETAEKFSEMLRNFFIENYSTYAFVGKSDYENEIKVHEVISGINELAKQFGVEVKE